MLQFAQKNPVDNSTNTDALPAAEVWANIGRVMVNSDDKGEISTTFIGLPYGLPIDTMKQMRGTGYLAQAKNALLDEVATAANDISAGEEVILGLPDISELKMPKNDTAVLDGLFIQIRRVNDATSRPTSDNPFLAAMAGNRLSVVK